jgi:hypothetical protein
MGKRCAFLCMLLSMLAAALPVGAADTRLGDSCDLAALGAGDTQDFLRFDRELRAALEKSDAAALASLIQFPLRVNAANGSRQSLNNPAAVQENFARVFPPPLRKTVLDQKSDSLFCKSDGGVMYGDGEIWVDRIGADADARFRVTTVNVPSAVGSATANMAGQVQLACATPTVRIVIDGGANHSPRYRAWNTPRSIAEKPDIELVGIAGGEGTGSCFHRTWHFTNGNAEYGISEPGCSGGSTPEHAQAQLDVLIGGKSQLTSWCF